MSGFATIDDALVSYVKHAEGFSAKAYGDYKQYSIGYGTRATSRYEVIDEAEADRRVRAELMEAAKNVVTFAPQAPAGVRQALTDLTFNAGPVWEHAELGKLILAGDYQTAKSHVLQYCHAGGVVNAGLVKRRHDEVSWFDHSLGSPVIHGPATSPGAKPVSDPNAPSAAATVATEAAAVLNTIQKIEPWILDVLPFVVPQAGPVVKIIEAFSPVILAAATRALTDIAQKNNGDLLPTLVELLQHLTPGQPNSPALSPHQGVAEARPDPVPPQTPPGAA